MIAYINGIQRRTHGERDEREKEAGEARLREKLKLIRNCTLLGTKAKKRNRDSLADADKKYYMILW